MSPLYPLCFLLAVFTALVVIAQRFILWRAERRLQLPISEALDLLIAQAKDSTNDPLFDIGIQTSEWRRGQRRTIETCYFVHPTHHHFFSFVRITKDSRATYRLIRWHRNIEASYFPPSAASECRSSWFISRMEQLCKLIDVYPKEKLYSQGAWAEEEPTEPDLVVGALNKDNITHPSEH